MEGGASPQPLHMIVGPPTAADLTLPVHTAEGPPTVPIDPVASAEGVACPFDSPGPFGSVHSTPRGKYYFLKIL